MIHSSIKKSIAEAAKSIGKTWPLYSFVTSNPLSGYEQMPFEEAVAEAKRMLNAKVFPETAVFSQAWNNGEINKKTLVKLLQENQLTESPEFYLNQMKAVPPKKRANKAHALDTIIAKLLAAFMDEGLAEWEMPNKREGFYNAWRKLAIYDTDLPKTGIAEIPTTSSETLNTILNNYTEAEITKIFTHHLAALPGWTGYIKYRSESNSLWQEKYPVDLQDYLAVRLWIAQKTGTAIVPKTVAQSSPNNVSKLQGIWLKAWDQSWQNGLVQLLENHQITNQISVTNKESPEAQLVFCIDTRSELIRRHIEKNGPYETFGYAGFFGIAMDYKSIKDGTTRKSCPPIVNSAYQVSEVAQTNQSEKLAHYQRQNKQLEFKNFFLKRMKNMLPSAFGYVEGSGVFYGISLLTKTLLPGYLYPKNNKNEGELESIMEPQIKTSCNHEDVELPIPLEEKVAIVKSAFDLLGWEQFAPLIVFAGHGSHSANNAFASSLDCGACAASPGRHNARMLAKLANMKAVKQALNRDFGIVIPATTVFIGAEHNTTTDAIVLFDSEVPASHTEVLQKLKTSLVATQKSATQERLGRKDSVALAHKKANNWGETRPEWGLAKNAGFIVGPRNLTKDKNLDGRCFLHSYNWKTDLKGTALEGIMQGPMVVAQWINNHYYFSTVDNDIFGSGSKITQNVTGKFGVVQGNGGDIKAGLPLQSVNNSDEEMYHQPLRLSVMIQAPISTVTAILSRNKHLKNLLDNQWIYLLVMDPLADNKILKYQQDLNWVAASD
ncbi:DUF2309 domain-containing protein [Flavobacterium crassostreae]|uniref:Probable inorganic carbon transporter subunit DabA n=1 Tax=Flavobacterium crassostreae TaxID=1763534 RepID=A0A1B9E047_9FLAO|nr:DUF2309 domain-containing protein [Flavobacterium crassostreae]OCB75325.1 hypothetical protein LPBF_07985 [Flavobacterium crassostreae]